MSRSTVIVHSAPSGSERHLRVVQSLRPPSSVSTSSSSSSVSSLSAISFELDQDQIQHRQRPISLVEADKLFDSWPRKSAYAVAELINTEQRFNNDLEDIVSGYLKPLTDFFFTYSAAEGASFIHTVFSNISRLQQIHLKLLNSLLSSCEDPSSLGRVFVDNTDAFSPYVQYCTNYPQCEEMLQRTLKTNIDTRMFIEHCQSMLGHALPLITYLLKPVQRIQRYHLLLEAILKGLNPQIFGFNDIKSAQVAMSHVAEHINQIKREQELAQRVQVIQQQVQGLKDDLLQGGGDLTSYGNLVAEVKCKVLGRRGGERWLLLFEKLMLCLKKKANTTYIYRGHLKMDELDLSEETDSPCVFKVFSVYTSSKFFTIQVESQLVKEELVYKFKSIIVSQMKEREKTPEQEMDMDTEGDKTEDSKDEMEGHADQTGHLSVEGAVIRRSRSAVSAEGRDLKSIAKKRRTLIVVANQRSQEAKTTLSKRRIQRQISTRKLSREGVVLKSYKPIKRDDFIEEDTSDLTLSSSIEDSGVDVSSGHLPSMQLPGDLSNRGIDEVDNADQLEKAAPTRLKRRTAIRRKQSGSWGKEGTRSQSFDLHKPSSPESTFGSQSLPTSSEHLKVPELQHSRSLSNPMPLIREIAVDGEDEKEIEDVDMGEIESKLDRGLSRYRSSTDVEQAESSLDYDISPGINRRTILQKSKSQNEPEALSLESEQNRDSGLSPDQLNDEIVTSSDTDRESTISGDSDLSRGELFLNDCASSPSPQEEPTLIVGGESFTIVSDSDNEQDENEEEENGQKLEEDDKIVTSSLRSNLLLRRLKSEADFAGMDALPGLSRHRFGQCSLNDYPTCLSKENFSNLRVNTSLPAEIDSVGIDDFIKDHSPPNAVVSDSLPQFNPQQTNLQQPSLDCILPTCQHATQSAVPLDSPLSDSTQPTSTDLSAQKTTPHSPTHDQHHSSSLPSSPTHYNHVNSEDAALTELLRTLTPPPTLNYQPPHHCRHDSISSQSTDVSIHIESDQPKQDNMFEEAEKQPVVDIAAISNDEAVLSNIQILPPKALPDTTNDDAPQNDQLRARPPTTSDRVSLDDPRILPSIANTLRQRSNTFPINNQRQRGRARVMSCVARLLETCSPNMQQTMAVVMVISLFSLIVYVMNASWY